MRLQIEHNPAPVWFRAMIPLASILLTFLLTSGFVLAYGANPLQVLFLQLIGIFKHLFHPKIIGQFKVLGEEFNSGMTGYQLVLRANDFLPLKKYGAGIVFNQSADDLQ